jgi:hypothetical protein
MRNLRIAGQIAHNTDLQPIVSGPCYRVKIFCRVGDLLGVSDVLVDGCGSDQTLFAECHFYQSGVELSFGAVVLNAARRAGKSSARVAFNDLVDGKSKVALVGTGRDISGLVIHGRIITRARSASRRVIPIISAWRGCRACVGPRRALWNAGGIVDRETPPESNPMASGQSEACSRILIDKALEFSGWSLLDPKQVTFELPTGSGRADYLLKDKLGRVLCVLGGKREGLDPYDAKEQARGYPQGP